MNYDNWGMILNGWMDSVKTVIPVGWGRRIEQKQGREEKNNETRRRRGRKEGRKEGPPSLDTLTGHNEEETTQRPARPTKLN